MITSKFLDMHKYEGNLEFMICLHSTLIARELCICELLAKFKSLLPFACVLPQEFCSQSMLPTLLVHIFESVSKLCLEFCNILFVSQFKIWIFNITKAFYLKDLWFSYHIICHSSRSYYNSSHHNYIYQREQLCS